MLRIAHGEFTVKCIGVIIKMQMNTISIILYKGIVSANFSNVFMHNFTLSAYVRETKFIQTFQ